MAGGIDSPHALDRFKAKGYTGLKFEDNSCPLHCRFRRLNPVCPLEQLGKVFLACVRILCVARHSFGETLVHDQS